MICYSCNKQKNQLHPAHSGLLKGTSLLLCQTCIESKHEPRWVIVMAGRQFGPEYVKDYIINRRYSGKLILAEDLIVG